jgi:GDP-4-dehydro-6-deoxy-D-mannose reductase
MEEIMKKVLITGIAGSGGSYLAEHIAQAESSADIYGIARWRHNAHFDNLVNVRKHVMIHECDLNDSPALTRILRGIVPDVIFHLASDADVQRSFSQPIECMENNAIGAGAKFFEAVRQAQINPTIVHCSTSEVYGQVDPKNVPITEECPLAPANPYAVSKLAQDSLAYVYWKSYGMKIIRTRMFTYVNPRRKNLFATAFAMQIARIEAYWVAAEKCAPGEVYNIGGTTRITVGKFLEILCSLAKTKIPCRIDPKLMRPTDVTLQIPHISKFITATGWKPRYSTAETIVFLLQHCRREVQKEVKQ